MLATIVDKFNHKFRRTPDQPCPTIPGTRKSSEEMVSEATSAIQVYFPIVSTTDSPFSLSVECSFLLAPHKTNLLIMPNQVAPVSSSNGYVNLYSPDLDNAPVFEKIVSSNKIVKLINTYFAVPPSVAQVSTPNKVIKKRCKTRRRKNIVTIKDHSPTP